MSRSILATLVLVFFLSPVTFSTESDVPMRDGRALMRAGDRLADDNDYSGALLKYKEAYKDILVSLRGLEFKHEVTPKLMSREQLQRYMIKALDDEYDPAEIDLMDGTLKVFGFAPPELDIKQTLISLYTEEIAGFYDSEEKQLFLISDTEPKVEEEGFFSKFFGLTDFSKEEQKVILAHELTHALHDQHYDLTALQARAKSDDDKLLALTALIEGDATVVMFSEQQRLQGQRPNIHRMPPAAMDVSFFAMRIFLPFLSSEALNSAPKFFVDSLFFPYHKGAVFVMHLTNLNGWDAVDEAWRDVPLSTEQILHPEKYINKPRDIPVALEIPSLDDLLADHWELLGKNVLGEFQVRSLLAMVPYSSRAAAGWDGDQYLTYKSQVDDATALVWLTTWDSPEDAHEFGAAYKAYLQKRLDLNLRTDSDKPEQEHAGFRLPEFQGDFAHQDSTRNYKILQHKKDVVVVEGFDLESTQGIVDRVFHAIRTEKTH